METNRHTYMGIQPYTHINKLERKETMTMNEQEVIVKIWETCLEYKNPLKKQGVWDYCKQCNKLLRVYKAS